MGVFEESNPVEAVFSPIQGARTWGIVFSLRKRLVSKCTVEWSQQYASTALISAPFLASWKMRHFRLILVLSVGDISKVSSTTKLDVCVGHNREVILLYLPMWAEIMLAAVQLKELHYGGNTRRIYILTSSILPLRLANKMECNRILWGFEHGIKVR